jgi:hypothetical protein
MNALRPSWAVILPTFGVSMTCWFLVRKACYGWRELLVDGVQSGFYRQPTARERQFVRECTGEPITALEPIAPDRHFGTHITEEFVTREESDFLLDELQDVLFKYGRGFSERRKAAIRGDLEAAGLDPEVVETYRYVSDIHQDSRPPKGVWGAGDAINMNEMPMVLRRLVARVQEHIPNIGAVRHVYIFHSPTGSAYRPPEQVHQFAGHEVLVLPLAHRAREDTQGGLVFTVTPKNRSHASGMDDVNVASWTTKDQDTYAPFRGLMRVYASARLKCGLGIRPVQYLGHSSNPLPLDYETLDAAYPHARPGAWGSVDGHMEVPAGVPLPKAMRPGETGSWWRRLFGLQKKETSSLQQDVRLSENANPEVAYIVFGFEGPMHDVKTRNKWKRWEVYAFGEPPQAHEFEKLEEDPMVGEEEVGEWYQVPLWMARNYWSIGRMGAS